MNIKKTYTFIVISSLSFLLLCIVQFYLVYNSYELKNQSYYFSERELIKDRYARLIHNDLLYPGGQTIIDSTLKNCTQELARLYRTNRPMYQSFKNKVLDSMFYQLKQHECLTDFFSTYKKERAIKDSIVYALTINSIEVDLNNSNEFISLYDSNKCIGGTLANSDKSNLVVSFSVSPDKAIRKYNISFSLYVDTYGRFLTIMKQMTPMFCISIGSVLIILVLFFITFRRWQLQKNLSEMKTDFINNITHEFNTPLSAIIVANKGLRNEKMIENKDNVRFASDIIDRQSRRLEKLVNQVLDMVSYSKITLHLEQYPLHETINELITDFKTKLDNANIHIHFQPGIKNDTVMLDLFYFTTLIINILDNAIKYNDSASKHIHISTAEDEHNLFISISDNGIGMTEETQKLAFTKFYRNIENAHATGSKGLGLGLYYVQKIVKAHNWQIKIQSKSREGAMFVIAIPKLNILKDKV